MTDKELLELAAKAAGWTGWRSKHGHWNVESPEGEKSTCCHYWNAYCPDTGEKLKEPTFADAIYETDWNPLTDDGDALRLAVKLKLIVTFADGGAGPHVCVGRRLGPFHNEKLPNKMFALNEELELIRRAIVRAAAEIGKAST